MKLWKRWKRKRSRSPSSKSRKRPSMPGSNQPLEKIISLQTSLWKSWRRKLSGQRKRKLKAMLVCVPPSLTHLFLLFNTKKRSTWAFWLGALFSHYLTGNVAVLEGSKSRGYKLLCCLTTWSGSGFVCVPVCTHACVVCLVWINTGYFAIFDEMPILISCMCLSKIVLLSWHRVLSVPCVVESSPLSDTSFTILPSSVTFASVHLLRRLSHSFELFLTFWIVCHSCLDLYVHVSLGFLFCSGDLRLLLL